jgi:hypothetical protein
MLTTDEFASAMRGEVRLLLHLVSKVAPEMLEYRPTAGQRSLLELLQYLTIVGPIHTRACLREGPFDMAAWRAAWTEGKAEAAKLDLTGVQESIGGQSGLFTDLMAGESDEQLQEQTEMFGSRATRRVWLVRLVLNHLAAYRMQLFLSLKACGRTELDTVNLWAGMDGGRRG